MAAKGSNHLPNDTPAWARVLVGDVGDIRNGMAGIRSELAEIRKEMAADRKVTSALIVEAIESLHDLKGALLRVTDLIGVLADRIERNTAVLDEVRAGQAPMSELIAGQKKTTEILNRIHKAVAARSNGRGNGRR